MQASPLPSHLPWHSLSLEESLQSLNANSQTGLSLSQIKERQVQFGPNTLAFKRGVPEWKRLLLQFHQPLIYILLAASLVTFVLKEWVDAAVIFAVVLLNGIIGYLQESKAAKALEALSKTVKTETFVLRDGKRQEIPSDELVPGDIVYLQSGDRVPADLRLIRIRDLQVDESALTGESFGVAKRLEVLPEKTILAERKNMAFASTLVTYGQATGVVVATGSQTQVGKISELISQVETLDTPLTRKIKQFSGFLLYAILGLSLMTFLIGLLRGQEILKMFLAAVALAVAAIPEGLPAALTITLAIGVSRMAKRNAVIRRLPAVEALGSTTVICSDKTGTLTKNQMTVQEIDAGTEAFAVTGLGYAPQGSIVHKGSKKAEPSHSVLLACLRAGALCNDSQLVLEFGRWEVEGDPTEGALLVAAQKGGINLIELNTQNPRFDSIPFESAYQYMATLHPRPDGQGTLAYVKGSVESLLKRSSFLLNAQGEKIKLDAEKIHDKASRLASQGMRVLALAQKEFPAEKKELQHDNIEEGLVFLGLQAMIDPPREEAMAAVARCQEAGIQVKMITGDHAKTAHAIAVQIGLSKSPQVITGEQIAAYSDEELLGVVSTTDVFARTSPEQKLRLVRSLQSQRQVVAMTGDGVNDAPALRQADIGVAMGVRGTEVAKESADMILMDDFFGSIAAAVEEGRAVFQNLLKFITWTLPTNVAQALVLLAAIAAGTALPISPVQILWINMTTAILLGLTLAFEPKEPDIMKQAPRLPQAPILSAPLLGRIFLVGSILLVGAFGLFRWARQNGLSVETAQTIAANVLVMGQLFYLFNCRSLTKSMFGIGLFSNLWVLMGCLAMVGFQLLFTYASVMQKLFGTQGISAEYWIKITAIGFLIYGVVGIEKWIRRRISL